MKLNEDQCKVMQALLDGKTVKIQLDVIKPLSNGKVEFVPNGYWRYMELHQLGLIGHEGTRYFIEEPAIKVALFDRGGRTIAMTQEETKLNDEWTQISGWYEITPNEVK